MAASPALTKMPRVIKNFNLLVSGYGMAGLCDEVRLPDIRLHLDEHRGAGMDVPIPIDLGMEKMELGFTMAEHNEQIFSRFGLINQNAVQVIFKAAMQDDTSTTAYQVTAQGMYQEVKLGTIRNGDRNKLEATIGLRYFQLSIGGTVLIEVDSDNFTRVINGVDQLAAMRSALGMDSSGSATVTAPSA